jgi:hypothetical protein
MKKRTPIQIARSVAKPLVMPAQDFLDNRRLYNASFDVTNDRLLIHQKYGGFPAEFVIIRPFRTELLSESVSNAFSSYAFDNGSRSPNFFPRFHSYQVFSPNGSRYILLEIIAGKRDIRKLFFKFCEDTKRDHAVIAPDYQLSLGRDHFSFLDATLVHERKLDALKTVASRHMQEISGGKIVSVAKSRLRSDTDTADIVERWSFLDQLEAKSPPFRDKVYACAKRRATAIEKLISGEFGVPTETGTSDCDSIPAQDVFRYAIWKKGKRQLYLCCSHFDQMTDVSIVLGTKKVR